MKTTKNELDSKENIYNIKIIMIEKEGTLTLKIKENTLKSKVGNYSISIIYQLIYWLKKIVI